MTWIAHRFKLELGISGDPTARRPSGPRWARQQSGRRLPPWPPSGLLRRPCRRDRTNQAPARAWGGAHVQFEDIIHHDDRLRAVAILGPGKLERLVAADKESAAKAALIPCDPVALAVLTDQEQRRLQAVPSRAVGTGVQIVHGTVLQSTKSWEPLRGLREQLSGARGLVVQSLVAQSFGVPSFG